MSYLVRRSNLIVPINETSSVEDAWRHEADAVTLDLDDGVAPPDKVMARALVKEAIPIAGRGGAEVFVRVNRPYVEADLEASVYPGLTGIILPKVEKASEVGHTAQLLEGLERRRGLEIGTLQLILGLESALGVWNAREVIRASPRVRQVALGESNLAWDLGIFPSEEYDPFVYARGRVVIEGIAAQVQPVGIPYPMGVMLQVSTHAKVLDLATKCRNLGFKGVLCPYPAWVRPVNEAFTSTQAQVEYHTRVRELFAQGVAAGTAAVPMDGKMIDVPVDVRAKDVLEIAAACRARDEQKYLALEAAAKAGSGREVSGAGKRRDKPTRRRKA